ncbi:MAG TPA: sulfurtransferase [Mycobacteriales bacterium]|nr:sulfurtransferase [Mycobacteriales bacterium]
MIPPYVDEQWLTAHPKAVLADVRWYADGRSGRQAYLAGHLPGAVFVALETALAGTASPAEGRHPMPDPEVFAEAMRALGISDGDTVVAYDDDAGVNAARLVWMLRVTGHDAALLDGGLTRWSGPLSTDVPARPRSAFTAQPWPAELLADIDDLGDLLVDARAGERYRGEVEPLDSRPGRIPGAQSIPCRENVGPDGLLLPDDVLRERFGIVDRPWVSACGSGVTACQNLLVAEHLGLPPGRLYAGSYSQWSATDRPVETG